MVGGFRVTVYTDDHAPAHVHVTRGGAQVRVYLTGKRALEQVAGRMNAADERQARRIVAEHRAELLALWRKYHR